MTTPSLDHDLETFLADLTPACSEQVAWRGGQIQLHTEVYLTDRPAPTGLTSSGRCIVLSGHHFLLMSNPSDTHILPGGRIEPGETIEEATRREVEEETGLRLGPLHQIAILVYRHLTPRPSTYKYPYPVFLNSIYVAEAANPGDLLVNDTYELTGEFVPQEEALGRIAGYQRVLLAEAMARLVPTIG